MLKIDIDFLGKYNIIPSVFAVLRGIYVCVHTVQHIFFCFQYIILNQMFQVYSAFKILY